MHCNVTEFSGGSYGADQIPPEISHKKKCPLSLHFNPQFGQIKLRKCLLPFSQESISLSKYVKSKIYRNIILLVVLYGCETWSFTLREGHRLKGFKNRVLRKVFGPKRDKIAGYWRRMANERLHDLCCSPNIMLVIKPRRKRCVGHVACTGERAIQGFGG